MSPTVEIVDASPMSAVRHATGGAVDVEVMRARAGLVAVVRDAATVAAAEGLVDAVRRLAEARGSADGDVPEASVRRCRVAEQAFLRAVRAELDGRRPSPRSGRAARPRLP